jgi:hypothetical protein
MKLVLPGAASKSLHRSHSSIVDVSVDIVHIGFKKEARDVCCPMSPSGDPCHEISRLLQFRASTCINERAPDAGAIGQYR